MENRYRLIIYCDYSVDLIDLLYNKDVKSVENDKDLEKFINQQSARIKELKTTITELEQENQQLAIDELEKIKKFLIEKIAEKQACFDSGCYNDFADGVKTICEILVWEIDKRVKILEEL